jgi:cytoskeletal protein CcmA (bactofilin family)
MTAPNGTRAGSGGPPITVIADGTKVDGSVNVTGDLRVDGAVEGTLLASGGACEIAARGNVSVDVARATSLIVYGRLRAAEVFARRVVVMPDGEINAQVIVADAVEVEGGGKLAANLEIGRSAAPVA